MELKVGSYAYVGGCVGKVKQLQQGDTVSIEVVGVYTDVMTGEPDPWCFTYDNMDLLNLTTVGWKAHDGKDIFDFSKLKKRIER